MKLRGALRAAESDGFCGFGNLSLAISIFREFYLAIKFEN